MQRCKEASGNDWPRRKASNNLPAHIFVGVGTSRVPTYLGTAKEAPSIDIKDNWDPVYNDVAFKTPMDLSYGGEEAVVSVQLTRWNEPVYAAIANRSIPGAARGFDTGFSRGSLMLTENLNSALWILYSFSGVPAFTTLPAGYRFPGAILESPDKLSPGTHHYTISLTWRCLGIPSIDTSGISFTLYDANMSGLPAIN